MLTTPLFRANLVLFLFLIAHTADHAVNQPSRTLPGALDVIGLVGFIAIAVSLLLALRRSPLAPLAAVLVGAVTAISFIAIHLLPQWGALSDPYWDFDANALSWVLVLGPTIAAAVLAVVGSREIGAARPQTVP